MAAISSVAMATLLNRHEIGLAQIQAALEMRLY